MTLNKGEADLEKNSEVNIFQILTVDKSDLEEKIGSLPPEKISEVLAGVELLAEPLPDPRT